MFGPHFVQSHVFGLTFICEVLPCDQMHLKEVRDLLRWELFGRFKVFNSRFFFRYIIDTKKPFRLRTGGLLKMEQFPKTLPMQGIPKEL